MLTYIHEGCHNTQSSSLIKFVKSLKPFMLHVDCLLSFALKLSACGRLININVQSVFTDKIIMFGPQDSIGKFVISGEET